MDYLTTKQAAEKWNISLRRVQVLCEQGRIKGVVRLGWAWAIPKEIKSISVCKIPRLDELSVLG